MQTYVNVGKTTVTASVAAISSAVGKAQSQNAISQPVASSIQGLLQTPAGATLVANSIVLANRAFAYITTHANAPATASPAPAQPASTFAVASGAAEHEAALSPGASPSMTMTGQQIVAIVESTNYVLQKAGKPALPSRGFARTPAGGNGAGGSGSDDSVQGDEFGQAVAGVAVGVTIFGEALGEAIADETGATVVIAVGAAFLDWLGDQLTLPPPDPNIGTGSGAGAVPGSIEGGPFGPGDDDSGSDGGEGIDDKPGHAPQ
jgi:hypothetical protein